jgi:hypothetical protein
MSAAYPGGCAGGAIHSEIGDAAAPRASDWLCLGAEPTFAMAAAPMSYLIAAKGHTIAEMLFWIESTPRSSTEQPQRPRSKPRWRRSSAPGRRTSPLQRAVATVTQEAIRVCGGRPFLRHYPLER